MSQFESNAYTPARKQAQNQPKSFMSSQSGQSKRSNNLRSTQPETQPKNVQAFSKSVARN